MIKKKILLLVALITCGLITSSVYATDSENEQAEEFKTTITSQIEREEEKQSVSNYMPQLSQKAAQLATLANTVAEDSYTYNELEDGTIEITGYTGTDKEISIPNTINGKKVTSIGESSFEGNIVITSVTVPDTIKTIGMYAFYRCTSLETVVLPDTVETLGFRAFSYDTKLTKITLGNGLKVIGANAFDRCTKLTEITIPDTVEQIQTEAFKDSGIESISLPKNLSSLGASVFSGCTKLQSISIASGNTSYVCEDGVIYNKDKTLLVYYLQTKTDTTFVMPNTVLEIEGEGFAYSSNLENIVLSNKLQRIGTNSFLSSGIKSIEFPETLAEVGTGAFMECENLTDVIIRGTLKGLSYWMFRDCTSLVNVNFDGCSQLYSFSDYAFAYCSSLERFELPETITIVGKYCFGYCDNLTTVVFNDAIEYIENKWNYNSPKLTNYTIPEGLVLLEDGSYSKVVTITLDDATNIYSYKEAWEVLDLLNQYRKEQGLEQLTMDTNLLEDAMLRAQETSVYFSHTRPNGLSCFTAMTDNASYVGENIAALQNNATEVMEAWKNSEAHNENMLSSGFKSVGIGCFKVGNVHYWVQLFSSIDGNEATRSSQEIHKTVKQQIAYDLYNNIGITTYYNETTGQNIDAWQTENVITGNKGETLVPAKAWIENSGFNGLVNYFEFTDATWESSNENAVKVNESGIISFVGKGTANVTMTLGNVTRTYKFETLVPEVPITSVTLDKTSSRLLVGDKLQLIATINPSNTTDDKTITWKSSNENVASVDNNGNVTAKAKGTTTITATTQNGKSASCVITVKTGTEEPTVKYFTHIQDYGWETEYSCTDGETSGKIGESKKIEAIKIITDDLPDGVNIAYQSHVQDYGWETAWAKNGAQSGTTGKNKKVEAIRIRLENTDEYSVRYRAYIQNQGWYEWVYDGEDAGTTGQNLRLEAIQIQIIKRSEKPTDKVPGVAYYSHVQDKGWESEYAFQDGETSGLVGKNKKVEAIKLKLTNASNNANILYQSHVQDYGWETAWVKNGAQSGTTGKNKKVEAIRIKLENMDGYSIKYRAYVQGQGWGPWVYDGEDAGTTGQNLKLEAIEVKVVRAESKEVSVSYFSHVQDIGWENYYCKLDGQTTGLVGKGKKVEAIKINLNGVPENANIVYQTHVQDYGWEKTWAKNGEQSGTTGKNKKIESIRIKLENLDGYKVVYRGYVQGKGWTNWVENGADCGTTGQNLKLEAVQIKVEKI